MNGYDTAARHLWSIEYVLVSYMMSARSNASILKHVKHHHINGRSGPERVAENFGIVVEAMSEPQ